VLQARVPDLGGFRFYCTRISGFRKREAGSGKAVPSTVVPCDICFFGSPQRGVQEYSRRVRWVLVLVYIHECTSVRIDTTSDMRGREIETWHLCWVLVALRPTPIPPLFPPVLLVSLSIPPLYPPPSGLLGVS
jgi:hypothetical protein